MTAGLRRRALAGVGAAIVLAVVGGTPAAAHPLGNFSINHLDALRFETDRIIDNAIIDTAEIPTAQADGSIDVDGDGAASVAELHEYGRAQCEDYRQALALTVDSTATTFTTTSSAFSYRSGQAGLRTTRLECGFEAIVAVDAPRVIEFSNAFAANRVGWHEIVATAGAVSLIDSTVPTTSVTDSLTTYPVDLLASPRDVREAKFTVVPGTVAAAVSPAVTSNSSTSTFSRAVGPLTHLVDRITNTFNDLIGRRQLTVGVGLLAIGLAFVLGASHALLPGHGKTVMAAYIAGRQGSVRDAVMVGATVTATHTGGVLLLGLALTLSTSLAGESVLACLGVISGLMIAVLGASLWRGVVRRRSPEARHGHHGHSHDHPHGHGHGHSHGFGHSHSHGFGRGHTHRTPVAAVLLPRAAIVGDDRDLVAAGWSAVALAEPALHVVRPAIEPISRRGLIGMGIAGGLVPSPSALVVLLSAIALGRTIFGVVLVIGYGAGMAGTLTLAGVLLVRIRDRTQHRLVATRGRLRVVADRWTRIAPHLTAALVLVVGLGLAVRSVGAF